MVLRDQITLASRRDCPDFQTNDPTRRCRWTLTPPEVLGGAHVGGTNRRDPYRTLRPAPRAVLSSNCSRIDRGLMTASTVT